MVPAAAEALLGNTLDEATLGKLDAAARAACKPIDAQRGTVEYRTKVAGVLARRAAAIQFERAGDREMATTHVPTPLNGPAAELSGVGTHAPHHPPRAARGQPGH